jgi:hypothetical protein
MIVTARVAASHTTHDLERLAFWATQLPVTEKNRLLLRVAKPTTR